MAAESEAEAVTTRRVIAACLLGGVVAGSFDISYAITVWGMRGIEPNRILQSVASGLLGPASFDGGVRTAALGAVLHFAMTTVMATVYVLASRTLPFLRANAVPFGMAYGGAIFLIMNFVVVPLSRARFRIPPIENYLTEFAVHIFFVGLPIALIARMYLGRR